MDSTTTVVIDGSMMEGGGQILRIALTLSCIKRIPIKVLNIRAGRRVPGLMEQHLKAVELARDMTNATVTGARLQSTELTFSPDNIIGGTFVANIKTAGSISLVLQVGIPCALFASDDVTLRVRGGTNVTMAPQIDYTIEVFKPILEKFYGTFNFDLIKRGYFPKGGGEVIVQVHPLTDQLWPIQMVNLGNITTIQGWCYAAGAIPLSVAKTIADSAKNELKQVCNDINIEVYKEESRIARDNATGIILVATSDTDCILGADALGNKGTRAETTGEVAAKNLIKTIEQKECVDEHCQDQIIVFMALAKGESKVRVKEITMHTKTAIFVAALMTNVKFEIEPTKDGGNIISCTGT